VKDFRRWYDRNWFATRNFHGQWYTDSDRLQELVPFRLDTFETALARAVRTAPSSVRMAGKVPAWFVKNFVIKPLTLKPRGTMAFLRDNDEAKISAYFGSREEQAGIGDWSTFVPPSPDRTPRLLDHGFDESKEPARWTRDDLAGAADFRGGVLLSQSLPSGDIATPLRWRCAEGHEFGGSPRLILTAGHWCPECVKDPAHYAEQAAANRFLAQIEDAYRPAIGARAVA
jgi:hypothetical protein